MRVRAGDTVDLIQFVKADGTSDFGGYSSNGGKFQPSFVLGPEELLVRVEAVQDEVLHALRLATSTGRISQWYGNPTIQSVQIFEGTLDNPIVGLRRSTSWERSPRILHVIHSKDLR